MSLLATAILSAAVSAAPSPERVSVLIKGSVEASLVREIGSDGRALAAQVARLLRWKGDIVRDIHPADQLQMLYRAGEEPELVALDYHGAAIELTAVRFEDKRGVPRYYDPSGKLLEPGMNQNPVPGYVQITETVQSGRGKRRHKGLDLKAPEHTPIVLPFGAKVSRVNWATRYNGNCVEVLYTEGPARGKLGRFLHLSEVAPEIRPGKRIDAGIHVGTVGNTGRSSAPHLHYEVRGRDGAVYSPLKTHGTKDKTLSPARKAAFEEWAPGLLRRLAGQTNQL